MYNMSPPAKKLTYFMKKIIIITIIIIIIIIIRIIIRIIIQSVRKYGNSKKRV